MRFATLGIALGSALWLACSSAEPPPELEVRVHVEEVGLDPNDMPVVLLEEDAGTRWLPIWIGTAEARSIAVEMEQRASPRPNTHDLARRVIHGLRGSVERVVVTDLRAGTYYAVLTLRADGDLVEIDSRPSDAIAIALRTGAPIFVRPHLLEDAAAALGEAREETSI